MKPVVVIVTELTIGSVDQDIWMHYMGHGSHVFKAIKFQELYHYLHCQTVLLLQ